MRLWLAALLLMLTACQSPETVYRDHLGQSFRFSEHLGRAWVILHYWSSWCHACRQVVPGLNQWLQRYDQRLVIRGVNVFETESVDLPALVRSFNMTYPTLRSDPQLDLKFEAIKSVPAMVLIDPQGQVHMVAYGSPGMATVQTVLTSHLKDT